MREFLKKFNIKDISTRLSNEKLEIIAKELENPNLPSEIKRATHEKLANVYEKEGDYLKAMHHYQNSKNMKKQKEMYSLLGK